MKQIQIRFLKQGLLHMEVPEDATIGQIELLGKEFIDNSSDQELFMAMSDCIPSGANPTRFDADNFQVEAIESEELELLYSTPLWDEYAGYNQ